MSELNIGSKVLVEGNGWEAKGVVVKVEEVEEEMVWSTGERIKFPLPPGNRWVEVRIGDVVEGFNEWQIRVLIP